MIIVSRRGLSRKLDSSNHFSESTGLFALRDIVFNVVVESVDVESQVHPRTRVLVRKEKKEERRKSRNERRSLGGIRYISWNRPAAIRLGPSAEMLEDILYSKRVVTLV